MTNSDRQLLIDLLSRSVHDDFAPCDGTGSVFCPSCVAIRSIHALVEVYEELDEIEALEENQETTPATKPAKALSDIDVDAIVDRVLRGNQDDDRDTDTVTVN